MIVVLFATLSVQYCIAHFTTEAKPSALLNSYYNLKNALVSSNTSMATFCAAEFLNAVNASDKVKLNEESRTALRRNAITISKPKALKVQREKFAALSNDIFALAPKVKFSTESVYWKYCPMKKASCLSNNNIIKNPYFSSAMFACGSTKETL